MVAKWTMPVYVGSTFPFSSTAVTVTENGSPAVGVIVEAVIASFAVAASACIVGSRAQTTAVRSAAVMGRLNEATVTVSKEQAH